MNPEPAPESPPPTAPREPTLGQLLMSALCAENAREHNRQVIERAAARSSLDALQVRSQVAGIIAYDPWANVPAALRLRAYANCEFGQDLTPEAVRRIRGRVCEILDIDTAAGDALPLSRVVEELSRADHVTDPAISDPISQFRWLRVRQVASLFDLNPGVVSKNADAGIFVTNGQTGFERRVDVLSVVRWQLERQSRPDDADG